MKIGIDARMYRSKVAGIGRYSQNLIKNLLEIDQENQYFLFMTKEDIKEFGAQNNSSNKNVKIIEADIPHFSYAEQTEFLKIIKKENLDLMHFLNFNHPVRYRGKYITVVHDLTLIYFPETAKKTGFIKKKAFRYVLKNACQNSQKIIAVSDHTKKDILKTFNIPEEKIKVIYEASDDKIFSGKNAKLEQNLREKYKINSPVILTVGQFRPHKNLIGLLEAYEILRKILKAKLVILGQPDKAHESLLEKIESSPFRDDILLPGFVSDEELALWYKIAAVFVFPSFYEGFGIPGLEAMTAGLPVAASNQASLPEIYKDAALYFDPQKPQDMASKVENILKSDNIKKDLICKGKKVAALYSWKKTARETFDLYKELLNSKS